MIALILLLQTQAPPALRAIDDWRVRVASADSTAITGGGRGSPLAPDGAELSLYSVRTPPPGGWATVTGVMPADSMRNSMVTLTADLSTVDAPEGAALWMRVDGPSGMLAFRNTSMDEPVTGTVASRPMRITLRANTSASAIYYGMILTGSGKAEAHHVRLTSEPAPTGPIASDARRLLDSAWSAVRQGAYWRDTVTWSAVEPQYWAMAEGASTTEDAYPAIRFLLARLGDHHSGIMSPAAAKAMSKGGSGSGGPASLQPDVKLLGPGMGYVMVPAFGSVDSAAGVVFARAIQDGIARVAPSAGCGWIVDLRPDGGGNMWPMLAGLKPFLGSGPVGYFQFPSGVRGNPWIAPGNVPPALAALDTVPVAVITGSGTASSGEAVTIAFRGRPRTRSFGQPTAGLANANSTVLLPDGGMMFLMTSVDVDRDGNVFGYKVDPSVIVPEGAPGTDPPLDVAISWLKAESRCR
jgi:carboxyl-terminal processing protease